MFRVELTAKGVERVRRGHLWVFASDLKRLKETPREPAVVTAVSRRGEVLGRGLYNPRSKIAFRLLSRGDETIDESFFRRRIEEACGYRARVVAGFSAYRAVHGEADGLPGLTVDRYGDYLVLQQHAAALEPFMPTMLEGLQEIYRPKGILGRNDAPVRALEGLERRIDRLLGEVPETIRYREGEVTLLASPYSGQKTGAFLDQRENHLFAGALARGRALDAFAYHGGFSLQLARQAASVLAVDVSAAALERLLEAAALNAQGNVAIREGNAFDLLRALSDAGERFDTIVLDPPAFAKSRSHLPKALAAYKEINLRALKMMQPGARLLSASCSYHIEDTAFYGMLAEAAADAGRRLRVLARRGQASCHPEVLGVPETHYLKLAAVEVTEVF
jgi:23S rRNA (cytosine1962-C5)-methyltransferase